MTENFENKLKKKRNAYVTSLQKEKLIDFITSNYGVLYGSDQCADGKTTKDVLWNQITSELNEIGAKKDTAGWKRCYASLKCSTNRKVKNSVDEAPKVLNALQMKIVSANQSKPRSVLTPKNTISNDQQKADGPSVMIATGTYSTPQQREQLVNLVSANFDALYGKLSNSANGAAIKNTVWKSIAIQLNAIGPKKDAQGWIRCFTGLKATTKEKLSVIRQKKNRNCRKNSELDAIHLEMHKMHHPDTLDGCQTIDELGFGKHSAQKASTTEDSTSEEKAASIDLLRSKDSLDFNNMKNDFENVKDYFAGVQENAFRIDETLMELLKRIDGSEDTAEMNDELIDLQKDDSTNDFNNDPTCSIVRSEAQESVFLDSADPDITDVIDYNDLSDDQQIALLLSGQLGNISDFEKSTERTDLEVAGTAVGIEEMEIEFEVDGQTKDSLGDKGSLNGGKIVILEEILISNICHGPPQQHTSSTQEQSRNINSEDVLATDACPCPSTSKRIENNITLSPTVPVVDITQPPTSSTQPPTSSTQPPTSSTQPPTSSTQPPTSSTQPPTSSTQPPTSSTQQQPQRRGVEINLNKFADSRREGVRKITKGKGRTPRRNRLSTPLGVMAQRALDEQVKTNALLAEILSKM